MKRYDAASKLASKASSRINLNESLLAIAIGVFFLTVNFREELLFQRVLVIQLVLSIPLLLTSILSYSKVGYRSKVEKWDRLGWITFIIAYAFLLNVIGILLGNIVGVDIALIFFVSSWILTFIYSFVDVSYKKYTVKERMVKDLFFILIQFVLGVLVVLGFI